MFLSESRFHGGWDGVGANDAAQRLQAQGDSRSAQCMARLDSNEPAHLQTLSTLLQGHEQGSPLCQTSVGMTERLSLPHTACRTGWANWLHGA